MENTTVTTTTTFITSTLPHDLLPAAKSYPVPVIVTSAVSCTLSVIGAACIFGTYYHMTNIRNFTRRLILCLTAADLLTCSGYLISVVRYSVTSEDVDSVSCLIQSMVTTYSSLVSFFLTTLIAFHMFVLIMFQYSLTSTTKTLVMYNLASWIIPGIIIIIAASQGALGADHSRTAGTGPWCWVDTNSPDKTMWMLLTGKGWEIITYLLTTSFYVLLKLFVCLKRGRTGFSQIDPQLRDEDKNLLYVWFLLYVVRIWGTTRFFIYTFGSEHSHKLEAIMEVLLYLQAAGDPSQAFINALLFCLFDKSVRRKLCGKENRGIVADEPVKTTEKTALIQNEGTYFPVSTNSDYGTGTSNSTTSSRSRLSELSHMADESTVHATA